MATPQNWVQQYEQSLANINIQPGTFKQLVASPAAQRADAPAMPIQIPVASPSWMPTSTVTGGTFTVNGPMVLMTVFGVGLLATVMGSGAVRTLGVVGMLGSVGLFLAGVSQIH